MADRCLLINGLSVPRFLHGTAWKEERVKVAQRFVSQVKPTIPVLVDELNDPVGHAYSGMPARLYMIDARGSVAYKSGRGPFAFLTGEMEQALAMTLLDPTMSKQQAVPKLVNP